MTCSKCGTEEFHQAIRSIGLEENRIRCPNCGRKRKAVFHPFPLAIALGDKWTTDANIIKGLYKGRDAVKLQRDEVEKMPPRSEDKKSNADEEL